MSICIDKNSPLYSQYNHIYHQYPFKHWNWKLTALWKKASLYTAPLDSIVDTFFNSLSKEQAREELKTKVLWTMTELVYSYFDQLVDKENSDRGAVREFQKVFLEINMIRRHMSEETEREEQIKLKEELKRPLMKLYRLTKDYFIFNRPLFFSKL